MRILILNWRDIKNPAGGGAELLTHEMAKRWVKWNHQVIQISAGFPGSQKEEIADGVRIIRLGNWWTVHLLTFFYYLKNLRHQIDIVIDGVHWFPFFAVVYARKKTVLLVCEVAKKHFFVYFPYPLALFWRWLEKIYLFLYRHTSALAISPSTKKDLIKEGFKKEKITVIPMGLSISKKTKRYPKEKKPTIIFLGRINKLKGIEDAIEVFKMIKKDIPQAKFWVVGSGMLDYEKKIKQKVASYSLTTSVKFFGFVTEKKKFELLSRAHLLIVPSVHEGWGLIVPEAGLMGTPAVVYNVAGLRDVVKNGINGIMVATKPRSMTRRVVGLLSNPARYSQLQKGAVKEAKKYNWEKTAKTALSAIKV